MMSKEDVFSENEKSTVCNSERNSAHKIYVVRSLQLSKIKFYGFDMDYTLASYISPVYEAEGFNLLIERLISVGYPNEIKGYKYDEKFPVRGLWFDKEFGTLLKVDQFGNILLCMFGFSLLTHDQLIIRYQNKFVQFDEKRFYILNTLFNLPEIYILACLVDYFNSNYSLHSSMRYVVKHSHTISYRLIFNDVRNAVDWIHESGVYKQKTVENLNKYVERDERIILLFERLRQSSNKVFLLTNSDFSYTNKIMEFLMNPSDAKPGQPGYRDWIEYFDYILVNAEKPRFFSEGTIMRSVDRQSGSTFVGSYTGPLEVGKVYSGGSCETFSGLIGARGKDVLYVGDHIYGDILKSKKVVGWRTLLVIPELAREIYVWLSNRDRFSRLQHLNEKLATAYKDMTISTVRFPNVRDTQKEIQNVACEMEQSYGVLGSLFRNGSRNTFLSSQVMRFADLYSISCLNLIYYPNCFMFRAPFHLMPHESLAPVGGLTTVSPRLSLDVEQQHPSTILQELTGASQEDIHDLENCNFVRHLQHDSEDGGEGEDGVEESTASMMQRRASHLKGGLDLQYDWLEER